MNHCHQPGRLGHNRAIYSARPNCPGVPGKYTTLQALVECCRCVGHPVHADAVAAFYDAPTLTALWRLWALVALGLARNDGVGFAPTRDGWAAL